MDRPQASDQSRTPRRNFATTRWSLVVEAGNAPTGEATQALEVLCRTYWYPLYAYARRWGKSAEDASDLTQEFFAQLLKGNWLEGANQDRGRFRTYLLTLFKRSMADEHAREKAWKRGGRHNTISLDGTEVEQRYLAEPTTNLDADRLFERRWAYAILEQVMLQLEGEFALKGKSAVFDTCKPLLTGDQATNHDTLAAGLGMTGTAFRVTVHRLRQRFKELLHQEIRQTVASPDDVQDELHRLYSALRQDS